MIVKEWRPAEGCATCKQAAKLFDEHTHIAEHTNGLAIKRIRELEAEVARLQGVLEQANAAVAVNRDAASFAFRDAEASNKRAEAAEAKLAKVRELPGKWHKEKAERIMHVGDCADELEAKLKEEKP